jgi:proteasome lid subunit RPN8/RPN11
MNLSPKPLEFAPGVWRAVLRDLSIRGAGCREAGAFLMCRRTVDNVVSTWIPYAELDPSSQHYDYVRLEPSAFTRLWDICDKNRLQILADIHTHPFEPVQSQSDREHPMLSLPGHVALIAPRFARGAVMPKDISFNTYLGNGAWRSYFGEQAAALIVAP